MIKAIVRDESELEALKTQPGFPIQFFEGDEAIVGGVGLILIGGEWIDKEAYDKKKTEEAMALAKEDGQCVKAE